MRFWILNLLYFMNVGFWVFFKRKLLLLKEFFSPLKSFYNQVIKSMKGICCFKTYLIKNKNNGNPEKFAFGNMQQNYAWAFETMHPYETTPGHLKPWIEKMSWHLKLCTETMPLWILVLECTNFRYHFIRLPKWIKWHKKNKLEVYLLMFIWFS